MCWKAHDILLFPFSQIQSFFKYFNFNTCSFRDWLYCSIYISLVFLRNIWLTMYSKFPMQLILFLFILLVARSCMSTFYVVALILEVSYSYLIVVSCPLINLISYVYDFSFNYNCVILNHICQLVSTSF